MTNMLNNKAAMLTEVFSNESFKTKAQNLKSVDELKKLLSEYDVEMTQKEVDELLIQIAEAAKTNKDGEVSDAALEMVSGGVWGYVALGAICLGAFVLGVHNSL
ncbi:MAG: hypothetical protein IJD94_06970 [Clostridia bacterium]|nr:hypothetical protein [Clostridia bacterium]